MSNTIPPTPPDPNEEVRKLREDLAKVQAERDFYLQAWIKLNCTDDVLKYTNEELLACVGRQPPLLDLIAELENDRES